MKFYFFLLFLGNTVDVYFHDVADLRSCQRECNQIADCHFWTMKPDADDPTDHMKCFLFKTCDYLDPCDECISGKYYIGSIALLYFKVKCDCGT